MSGRKRRREEDEGEVPMDLRKKIARKTPKLPDLCENKTTLMVGVAKSTSRTYPKKLKTKISRKKKPIIQIEGQLKMMDFWKSRGI